MNQNRVSDILLAHLQNAKVHGDRYIQSLCPFHSESEPSFVYYFDKEYYKCFSCGAHGHLNDLLKLWNIEPESKDIPENQEKKEFTINPFQPSYVNFDELGDLTREYFYNLHKVTFINYLKGTKIIQNKNHEYWLNRGISVDTIARMEIGCGQDSRGFFYSIPYLWDFGSKIEIVAIKKVYPKQAKNGLKDSYALYPTNIEVPIYNMMAINFARINKKTLCVYEGEKDVLMAVEKGQVRTSIGIAGKNAFKLSFLPLFQGIKAILLFLDNDANGEMEQIKEMFDKYRTIFDLPIVHKFNWSYYSLPQGGDFTDLIHQNLLK